MFERWLAQIRGQTSAAASPVAEDRMAEAVALWGGLYRGQAPWLAKGGGLELPPRLPVNWRVRQRWSWKAGWTDRSGRGFWTGSIKRR